MQARDPCQWTWEMRAFLASVAVPLALGIGMVGLRDHGGPRSFPHRLFDVNSDPAEVLEALPQIGPTYAARIVEARERAPFHSVSDLDRRVRGIGPKRAEALRPHLRFDTEESEHSR
jgi:hypothetical protein